MTTSEIETRFGIADALRFDDGRGGLRRAVVSTPLAEGEIYLHGAHLTAWTPRGQRPVIFVSSRSAFESGKPIRGGVPVVSPWFGPRGGGLAGPMHGFARLQEWSVAATRVRADGAVALDLTLDFDSFHLRFGAAIGTALEMELEVRNDAAEARTFEEALHTYFHIGDIGQAAVSGLAGSTYIDKADGFHEKQQPAAPIRFTRETDQVHLNTQTACVIDDAAWQRRIVIGKSGSDTTVVWNPWIAKTATLADMAPEDWREMVCVETANAASNAVTLAAGASHRLAAVIRVE